MKYAVVAVNAKYIHTSPAVRILNKILSTKYDSDFFEFTIKDKMDHIIKRIIKYDVIMFSVYIWNVEYIKEIVSYIRSNFKDKIVVAGGPEVSYDYKSFLDYFDYIMLGEGEEIIIPFVRYLNHETDILVEGVASKTKESKAVYVKDLNNVPSIFDTYTKDDLENRIIYVETSRGCPFNCSYCLSSLDDGVRFFSDERIEEIFSFIEHNKFKCLKFLDRTFNINPKRFLSFLRRLEKTDGTYQFEIEAELFTDEVIDYFMYEVKPQTFRLEIGIQTLNSKSLDSVDRNQNSNNLIDIINRINSKGRVVIHSDLIAGLPFDTIGSFKSSFNKVFSLKTDELQLGFLKLLRGTKIRLEDYKYNYKYKTFAPYEVISNDFMNEEDINKIHKVEESLEFMWNDKRCVHLINHLINDKVVDSFFDFFMGFSNYYKKDEPLHNNYLYIVNYLKDINIYKIEYLYDLKIDFLNVSRVKPMPFWRDKAKDNYLEKEYDYKMLGLSEEYNNAFITDYYDKFIVIKYIKGLKPILEIKELDNNISKREKSK